MAFVLPALHKHLFTLTNTLEPILTSFIEYGQKREFRERKKKKGRREREREKEKKREGGRESERERDFVV